MAARALDDLIALLAKLPGLGPRSARRAALHLIKQRETLLRRLAVALADAADQVRSARPAAIWTRRTRAGSAPMPSATTGRSAWSRTWTTCGRWNARAYFAGAITCSAAPCRRSTATARRSWASTGCWRRVEADQASEVILATSATVDGQTTAHYIADRLSATGVTVTRLAHGLPVGGELNYLDDGTLGAALEARRPVPGHRRHAARTRPARRVERLGRCSAWPCSRSSRPRIAA